MSKLSRDCILCLTIHYEIWPLYAYSLLSAMCKISTGSKELCKKFVFVMSRIFDCKSVIYSSYPFTPSTYLEIDKKFFCRSQLCKYYPVGKVRRAFYSTHSKNSNELFGTDDKKKKSNVSKIDSIFLVAG